MNIEVLKKIKGTSILFSISLLFLIVSYGMYQTLDLNANNLKEESTSLQNKLLNIKKSTKKNLTLANTAIDFVNNHQNLFFINVKDEFELIKFNKDINKIFTSYHPNSKFTSKGIFVSTKTSYYQYPFTFEWKYKNSYYLYKLLNILNNNYFYSIDDFSYDSKKSTFKINASLYAKNNVKTIINKNQRKKRIRKRRK